ncbi:MAG: hypothetical protein HOV79_00195 [Hamadaea sp.]|nr:hypothetical protein [Hamadaea sp.]
MSARGWTGSVALATGLAAATGAAQLGVGYGLGIIGWRGDAAGWAAALAWTIWVAALSVVVAAVAAQRRTSIVEPGGWGVGLWRASVACAAALGGLAVVPLTALPAREVATAATFAPAWVVGWYAAAGVLVGLVLAGFALASRAVAANLTATAGWWWLVAVVTVVDAVASGRGLIPTQLGVWRFTRIDDSQVGEAVAFDLPGTGWWQSIYLPGALFTLVAAFLLGVLAAVPAARRGESRASVALSGMAGPILMAAASLLAAPRLGGAPAEQVSALLVAPYAVIAGLAGSVLIAVAAMRGRAEPGAGPAAEPLSARREPVAVGSAAPVAVGAPSASDAAATAASSSGASAASPAVGTARVTPKRDSRGGRGTQAARESQPGDDTSADAAADSPTEAIAGGPSTGETQPGDTGRSGPTVPKPRRKNGRGSGGAVA